MGFAGLARGMKGMMGLVVMMIPVAVMAEEWSAAPLIGLDAQFGGDSLATLQYTDGTDQELNAGNGLVFNGGVLVETPVTGLDLRAVIGWKYSSSMASNVDVSKTAFPIELTARYDIGSGLFVGGGLTRHLSPNLTIGNDSTDYESSTGFVLRAGWEFIVAGYSSLEYDSGSNTYDASSFNIGLEVPLNF